MDFKFEFNKTTGIETAEVIHKETFITISGLNNKFGVWKTNHESGMVRQNPSSLHYYTKCEAVERAEELLTQLKKS